MATIGGIWRRLTGTRVPPGSLLLVVDQAGWILDEVARELHDTLPASIRCFVVHDEWRTARDCTIHFINRPWAWSQGGLDDVHASNRLIGLWWHGRLDSPEPGMRAALERLRVLHERFERIQVTCSIAHRTLTALGVPESKIVTLPEGVNLETFRPGDDQTRRNVRRELDIPDDALVVGSFQKDGDGMGAGATPKMIKGPDVLVDVLSRLRAQLPVLALLPGPARGYVTERLTQAGVPFRAPGFVPRDQLPRLYHALDVYLSPSRDEGGPAGVLESMASGVPIVSTRTGMPADIVDDGVNGGLVDVDDVSGLASRCATLLQDRSLGRRVADRALATIRPYDWRVLAPRYAAELFRGAALIGRIRAELAAALDRRADRRAVPNPAAVVAINRRPVSTPWGGGNQWIDQMTRSLRAHGYSVVYALSERVDCVLLVDPRSGPTASFDVAAIEQMKKRRRRLAVIQRVNDNDKHRGSDFRDALHAAAHRVADHTVFLSQWLCDYESSRWFDPVEPHSVIHNGADARDFHPAGGAAWQPGQPLRLVTHHWSREWNKGFRVYRAIDEQIAGGSLAGVELWVVGRWPEEIAWRAARTFPAVGPAELGALLRQCHAYVTASQWESGGMHFIEGAQCGLPVVYHVNGGGIVEIGRRFGVEFDADVSGAIRQMQERYGDYRAAVLADPPSGDRMCDAYRLLIQRTIERKRDAA